MSTCKNGCSRMPTIVAGAVGDIRHRLWSLYWLARMTHTPGNVIVELGVRNGDSTRAFLAACEDGGGELHSWDVEDVAEAVRVRTSELGLPWSHDRWHFTHDHSVAGGISWGKPGGVDLIFVDTDHTYHVTQAEISIWHKHLRVGGCMVFHDYWLFDPPRDKHQGRGVKMAVDEFGDRHPDTFVLETHDAGPDGDTGLGILWRIG